MTRGIQIIQVATSFGKLALRRAGEGSRPPLFCIHGNSSCSQIYKHVLESDIANNRTVLAIDLPGHGDSEDAKDPAGTYTMPKYAKACVEVLTALGYKEAVVVGWSLGGHVGTEMLPLFPGMKGLGIIASMLLPIFPHGPPQDDRTKWNTRRDLTDDDLTAFSKRSTGGPWEQWMADAAIRTDHRARWTLFENLGYKDCSDQQKLIAETKVPTAVIVGTDEPVHDIGKIKALPYGNLWRTPFEIPGARHTPVWEKPDDVVPILRDFVEDVA